MPFSGNRNRFYYFFSTKCNNAYLASSLNKNPLSLGQEKNADTESLLRRCLLGDPMAQMKVYDRYYHAMYNTAFRILGNGMEAEDIMQESFLSAFTKLDTFKGDATFGTWLKRIVVNNSIRAYREKKRFPTEDLGPIVHKVAEDDVLAYNEDTGEKARIVLQAIGKLKENYRILLTLSLVEGYDYQEIGRIMNMGYGNCRTMLSRAKERLRKELKPYLDEIG